MRKFLCIAIAIFFIITPFSVYAEFPNPIGYVNDYAGILSPEVKDNINQLTEKLKKATTAEIAVVIPKSLNDMEIDDYAYELFKKWGIGNEIEDNGVLIIVAPNERKSRIEVGKGLEGRLTDGKTGYIQDQYLIPKLQQNDYNSGISDTFYAIFGEVAKEYNLTAQQIAQTQTVPNLPAKKSADFGMIILIVIAILLFILDMIFFGGTFTRLLLFMFLRGGGGYGGSGGGFGGFGGGSSGGGGSSRSW